MNWGQVFASEQPIVGNRPIITPEELQKLRPTVRSMQTVRQAGVLAQRMRGEQRSREILRLLKRRTKPMNAYQVAEKLQMGHGYAMQRLREMAERGEVKRVMLNKKECAYLPV